MFKQCGFKPMSDVRIQHCGTKAGIVALSLSELHWRDCR